MYVGPEPECQITQEWIDDLIQVKHGPTRYFATLNTDTNDYSSVEYRIAAITPDASSTQHFLVLFIQQQNLTGKLVGLFI